MKGFWAGLTCGLVIAASLAVLAADRFYRGERIFVKVAQENLRDAPQGEIIASLNKGSQIFVVADSGKWVLVNVVGYIWKESVTSDQRVLKGTPYRASMIVVRTEEEAREIIRKYNAGADFAELAREYTIDAASAKRSGDLGEFYRGELSPEVENAVINLKVNEISGIIKSNIGFHIFKRTQ